LDRGKGYLLESDSPTDITLITHSCPTTWPIFPLLNQNKHIMEQAGTVKLSHNFRETNQVANALAKSSTFFSNFASGIYDFIPDFIFLYCQMLHPQAFLVSLSFVTPLFPTRKRKNIYQEFIKLLCSFVYSQPKISFLSY